MGGEEKPPEVNETGKGGCTRFTPHPDKPCECEGGGHGRVSPVPPQAGSARFSPRLFHSTSHRRGSPALGPLPTRFVYPLPARFLPASCRLRRLHHRLLRTHVQRQLVQPRPRLGGGDPMGARPARADGSIAHVRAEPASAAHPHYGGVPPLLLLRPEPLLAALTAGALAHARFPPSLPPTPEASPLRPSISLFASPPALLRAAYACSPPRMLP